MRRVTGFWLAPTNGGASALVVTAAFFALGGLAGGLTALRSGSAGMEAMGDYLDRFLASAQSGGLMLPGWGELLWHSLRWPLGALLLGFTAFGVFGIPALSSLRGFFLAFSVCAFARAYGRSGLTVAFLLLGLPGAVAVPAFLVLAAQSFSTALVFWRNRNSQGKREWPFYRDSVFRCGVCAAAMGLSLLIERYLVPVLVMGYAAVLRS